jgi:hypothetical protein
MEALYHAVEEAMKMVVNCVQGQEAIVATSKTIRNSRSNIPVSDLAEVRNTALRDVNESPSTPTPSNIDPDKPKLQVDKETQTEDTGATCLAHTGSIERFPPTPWRGEAQIDISRLPLAPRTYAVATRDLNGKHFLAVTISKRMIDYWNSVFSCEMILDEYGSRLIQVDDEVSDLRAEISGGEDEMANIDMLRLQERLADLEDERARFIEIRERKLHEHNHSLDNLGLMWQSLLDGDLAHLNSKKSDVAHDPNLEGRAPENEFIKKVPPTRLNQDTLTLDEVMQNVYDKRLKLQEAQASVDNIKGFYNDELAEYQAYVAADKIELSRSNFDRIMLINARDTTRRLIAAERELKDAREMARNLGAFCGNSDQESDFQDFLDDGYRISEEAEAISSVDRAAIERWLAIDDVEYGADPEEPNLDVKTVGISDSISVLADGSKRRRIDRWRLECEKLKNRVSNT